MDPNQEYGSGGLAKLAPGRTPQRQIVCTLSKQTGDVAHVAAAAALDPKTDILFISGSEETPEDNRKSEAKDIETIDYFKRAASIPNDLTARVRTIRFKTYDQAKSAYPRIAGKAASVRNDPIELSNKDTTNVEFQAFRATLSNPTNRGMKLASDPPSAQNGDAGQVWASALEKLNDVLSYKVQLPNGTKITEVYMTYPVVSSTFIVAEKFKNAKASNPSTLAALYTQLATNLSLTSLKPADLFHDDKFGAVKLPDGTKPVLLLWSRYTGGNDPEAYNPEGDSDVAGQQQLLDLASKRFDVITIGHDYNPKDEFGKTRPSGPTGAPSKFGLGEYYLTAPVQGTGRGGQMSFMLALMQRYPGALYQMGQKTGGMDAGAIVGIPTLYIEDVGSDTAPRMNSWTVNVPFYARALISEPPTFLGKALRMLDDDIQYQYPNDDDKPKVPRGAIGRRLARLYVLRKLTATAAGKEEPAIEQVLAEVEKIKGKGKEKENEERAKKLEAEIDEKTVSVEKTGVLLKGYWSGDLKLIETELAALQEAYKAPTSIIRDKDGKYVVRGKN